ncbi:MAG: AAA family ATPase [Burkholderiales bacterium]|nr:AAA family ATPase [Burkholderiales bacterium]
MPPPRTTSRAAARAPAPAAQVRLLGDPALLAADGTVKALERRAAGLLALVALEPGVTRARAAALLWPDSDNARRALRQQIGRFKRNYGAELIDGTDALAIAEGVAVDALQAGGGALLGNQSFDDCEDFNTWLSQQRAQRHGGVTAALAQQIAEAEARGDLESATRLAEQLLQSDNDSEAHHRTLMRLHYLRGDIAQAQVVYERLLRHLKTRFGAQPSADTEQLALALRAARQPGVPIVRSSTSSRRPIPVTILRPPRMIGRSRELAALIDTWQVDRAALLLGEPGLGKSRLQGEFAAGRRVFSVQGRPGDAGVPYATLTRLLRSVLERATIELPAPRRTELARLLPELAPSVPLPADGQRLLLQGAVEGVLAQASIDGGPIEGVLVDDLHFADDASVEMLQSLINAEALQGLRWVLAQRPGEGSAAAATLRATLEEAQALVPIALAPLTEADMAELIDSLGLPELDATPLAPQLVRHTGGNPLYALETLKQGLATGTLQQGRLPTPVNVGALIERRLKQLTDRALSLARVAAIAGVDFSIALAEEVMGARAVELADAWGELEAAQVLRESAFAHDLVYDAVLRSIPNAIAHHLHGATAAFLESHASAPARLGAHWEAARVWPAAGAKFRQAAALARNAARWNESAALLARATACFERAGDHTAQFEALVDRVTALMQADFGDAAVADADRLHQLARTDVQRVRAARVQVGLFNSRGEHDAAVAAGLPALALARRMSERDEMVRIVCPLSGSLCMLRRPQEALEELWPLKEWVDAQAEPTDRQDYLAYLAIALDNAERLREAERVGLESIEAARALGRNGALSTGLSNLAVTYNKLGRSHDATAFSEQACQLLRADPDALGQPLTALAVLGRHYRDSARYGEALHLLDEAYAGLTRSGTHFWADVCALWIAITYFTLGQHARALHILGDTDDEMAGFVRGGRMMLRADIALATGQQAAEWIERAQPLYPDESGPGLPARVASLKVAAPADAVEAAGRLAETALARERFGVAMHAWIRQAEAATVLGRGETAVRAIERALALSPQHVPEGLYEAALWLGAVRAYRAAGRGDEADAALRSGSEWIMFKALPNVPPEFRDSFLNRNPVNRALLQAARARPALAGSLTLLTDLPAG